MIIIRSLNDLREQVRLWHGAGETVALVPTMGALHDGHLSLVTLGKQNAKRVVTSVFVNPTQFAPHEDFDAYPRDLDRDAALLSGAGCDALYTPDTATMYPDGFSTTVSVSGVTAPMEGVIRPTHFAGVATVVCKLLNRVSPDIAIFGEKDYQQLAVIHTMVRDLDMPVRIIGAPIMRDHDGLALSSRNAYLSSTDRTIAGQINVIMARGVAALRDKTPIHAVIKIMREEFARIGITTIDYIAIVDPVTLDDIQDDVVVQPARLLVAVHVGATRLIDNMAI